MSYEFSNLKDINIVYEKSIASRSATLVDFPTSLNSELKDYLREQGITKLYSHQSEMFIKAKEGQNIVITTSTASGKTLSFLLPILNEILANPSTRALLIYPTKALASDQARAMLPIVEYFGSYKVKIGVYDGDTPVNERVRIRSSANLILTNPEMLNSSFLANHSKNGFNHILKNLKFVVIDELHSYRGAFGSHLSNLFKRLKRLCDYYSSSPQFLCSSATINNPLELAENICGKSFVLIDNDGSPSSEKNYHFVLPPMQKNEMYPVPIISIASALIEELVVKKQNFIAFCKSRRAVEVLVKEARDNLQAVGPGGYNYSTLISGYRGGYTALERKEIENKMINGNLLGLVSTNALELGIDIGKIDNAVLTGYPGTRASFWQQAGRAGRKERSADTYLILDFLPFDQYLALEPEWLFSQKSENAVVNKNNLFIEIAHVRAAAAELPLSLDDISLFPDLGEIIPHLFKSNEIRKENGKFSWCGNSYPAGDFSLRNIDKNQYNLVEESTGQVITVMDELQTFRELYPNAIYIHDSISYQVRVLDLKEKIAKASIVNVNYYTVPYEENKVSVLSIIKEKEVERCLSQWGDVNVVNTILGFKKVQFHNHTNLGFVDLEESLSKDFDTEGIIINLPKNVSDKFYEVSPKEERKGTPWKSYFDGICFALNISAMMVCMATNEDIAVTNYYKSDESTMAVCIYDLALGGMGYSAKIYDLLSDVIANAITRVKKCKCRDGCPNCVGDYHLDKNLVLWGLENLIKESEPLLRFKTLKEVEAKPLVKPFALATIEPNWQAFKSYLEEHSHHEQNVNFLLTIKRVKVEGDTLYLYLENEFYKDWILNSENYRYLVNTLSSFIECTNSFKIDFIIENTKTTIDNDKTVRYYKMLKGK